MTSPSRSSWTPGDGWREANKKEATAPLPLEGISYHGLDGWHYWIREEPVPPLPTEPYTVIRVTWKSSRQQRTRPRHVVRMSEEWYEVTAMQGVSSEALLKQITGFEVLSEPRAVTAKAVIGRVAEEHALRSDQLDKISSEFGVDS